MTAEGSSRHRRRGKGYLVQSRRHGDGSGDEESDDPFRVELYSICVGNLIPEALEALEKSASPLEARRMRIVIDSAGRTGTTGLVTVYTAGRAHLDGISNVTAMPDALLKSVVVVLRPTCPAAFRRKGEALLA
ncbi:hypothetical protein IW261DRAFT_1424410 [Armillaria novae-zelandiae]|uniref:Uncharacterized protein n=1 Tax=Armillaria novae-zelandiae TaxID=153914 RepID=A0AA39NVH7_9AGAR|nr:hypothetical protein IW261DRAFT_1424410 [Armillaria novae-zelandiae]